jgi:hypothetical protein
MLATGKPRGGAAPSPRRGAPAPGGAGSAELSAPRRGDLVAALRPPLTVLLCGPALGCGPAAAAPGLLAELGPRPRVARR